MHQFIYTRNGEQDRIIFSANWHNAHNKDEQTEYNARIVRIDNMSEKVCQLSVNLEFIIFQREALV